jgi:hypothetical protein
MFAAEVPADIHQFHGVECAATPPHGARRARFHPGSAGRYETRSATGAPRHAESRHAEQRDIDIFEETARMASRPCRRARPRPAKPDRAGIFSRSMIFFSTIAAVMFTAWPEL